MWCWTISPCQFPGHPFFLLTAKHLNLIRNGHLPTLRVWGRANTHLSSQKLQVSAAHLLSPLAANLWACGVGSRKQMQLLWFVTGGVKMQGSKDGDECSLAVEASAVGSCSQGNRAAVPTARPRVWGHLYPQLKCTCRAQWQQLHGCASQTHFAAQLWCCLTVASLSCISSNSQSFSFFSEISQNQYLLLVSKNLGRFKSLHLMQFRFSNVVIKGTELQSCLSQKNSVIQLRTCKSPNSQSSSL